MLVILRHFHSLVYFSSLDREENRIIMSLKVQGQF